MLDESGNPDKTGNPKNKKAEIRTKMGKNPCFDHHNPLPMEKQKWGGQDSGVADLQEKIDTASCGEE